MDENIQKASRQANRLWVIVGFILLAWAIGATIAVVCLNGKLSDVYAADGSDLVALAERQHNTILSLQNDLDAAAEYIRAADEDARTTDDLIKRAYGIAKSSDDRFVEFGNKMGGAGRTLQNIITRQQRIDELIRASEADNRAIKVELGMRLGEDN